MTEPCFRKKDSDPPVCGVHHAILLQKMVSIDANHSDAWTDRVFDLPHFPSRGSRNKKDMIADIHPVRQTDSPGAYQNEQTNEV
jgi:hypothetical protein